MNTLGDSVDASYATALRWKEQVRMTSDKFWAAGKLGGGTLWFPTLPRKIGKDEQHVHLTSFPITFSGEEQGPRVQRLPRRSLAYAGLAPARGVTD